MKNKTAEVPRIDVKNEQLKNRQEILEFQVFLLNTSVIALEFVLCFDLLDRIVIE